MTVDLSDNEYELTAEQTKAITQLYNAVVSSTKRAIKDAKRQKLAETSIDDIKLNVEFLELFMQKLKIGFEENDI